MKRAIVLLSCLVLLGAVSPASAGISAAEVDRLGKDLTPMGAEKRGNDDSTIPEWTGGLTEPLPGWPNANNYRPNPFADDKVLFTITKDNMDKYADKLPEAMKGMLKAYPDHFKMNIYPTRRTAACPQRIYDSIKANATKARLVNDGNGVADVWGAIPFPIPANGYEVLWNHMLRFQGVANEADIGESIVYTDGTRLDYVSDLVINYCFFDPNVSAEAKAAGNIFNFAQTITSPARDAGEGWLVQESIDPMTNPRKAWTYDPGERRVRRAPNLAFDTPDRTLNVVDDYDMFSGSPERYNMKLVGKKEMYVPYNNNEVNSPNRKLEEVFMPIFMPSEIVRYELHRVWVVEATLKEGQRHIYARRLFYMDEDTWAILVVDKYDGSGNLWRLSFNFPVVAPEIPVTGAGAKVMVDLKKNGYYVFPPTVGEGTKGFDFEAKPKNASYFTPAAMRRRGR